MLWHDREVPFCLIKKNFFWSVIKVRGLWTSDELNHSEQLSQISQVYITNRESIFSATGAYFN